MGHIFVAISGAGLRLIPASAPYRIRVGTTSADVEVECQTDVWKRCTVSVNASGYRTELGANVGALSEVLDVYDGPQWEGWWLETSLYRARLPAQWTAFCSGNPDEPSMFDLLGPGESTVFIQVPRHLPRLDRLIAAGQRELLRGRDDDFVEVGYMHEGTAWVQRHELRRLGDMPVAVTLQAPERAIDAARSTFAALLESLQRTSA